MLNKYSHVKLMLLPLALSAVLTACGDRQVDDTTQSAGSTAEPPVSEANASPVIAILEPSGGSNYSDGDVVSFRGGANDAEDGILSSAITWKSSIDGSLGQGSAVSMALAPGKHVITARVSDSGGLSASSTVTVNIAGDVSVPSVNAKPVVNISAPFGTSVSDNQLIALQGSAIDAEDGDITVSLAWRSSQDGNLPVSGGLFAQNLSIGTHTITATATDSADASGSDSIQVSVVAGNAAPAVVISALDGKTVTEGESLQLTGRALDAEDGNISGGLAWRSSLDGSLASSGATFNEQLSLGTHTITATVKDSAQAVGSGRITVTVVPDNLVLTAYYVDINHPDASDNNPGTEDEPWETIAYAGEELRMGDMVYIKAGVYLGDVDVEHSGARGQEIVFQAFPGDERKVIIENGTFSIKGESHIKVMGLKIQNVSDSYGIRIEGDNDSSGNDIPGNPPVENITLSGNHFYDTYKSAISVWGVRYQKDEGDFINIVDLVIEYNLVEKANNGGYNENITLANGVANAVVRFNEVTTGGDPTNGGEGIDFKDGVRDSQIHDNYIHGLNRRAIYVDGGEAAGAETTNIHVYNNLIIDDPSSAIMLTSEGPGNIDGIYVYNNVILGSEQSGISVYNHPQGRGISDVHNIAIFNNTVIDGGRGGSGWGGISINHPEAENIIVRNNIAVDGNGFDIDIKNDSDATVVNNLCGDSICEYQGDPLFVNPTFNAATQNYRLRAGSPAIDVGLEQSVSGFTMTVPPTDADGVNRPQGAGLDLGAYEYMP